MMWSNLTMSQDLMISRGQPALYDGVLVSPSNYKQLTIYRLEYLDFKKNENEYLGAVPQADLETSNWIKYILSFVLGFTGGYLVFRH